MAHPYSQLQLNNVLYKRKMYGAGCGACTKTWRKQNFPIKLACLLRHTVLLPFLVLIYIASPNLGVSKNMRTPIVKFMSHTGSFVIFLGLLITSAFQDMFHQNVRIPSIVGELIEHMALVLH